MNDVISFIKQLNIVSTTSDAIKEINKLINYLNNNNIRITNEMAKELLNVASLRNNICFYIKNNIINDVLKMEVYDINLMIIIEEYCDLNNILINNDIEVEFDKVPDMLASYMKDAKKNILTKEEIMDLFQKYHNGDVSARKDIIEHNLMLVVKVAAKYQNRGLELLDLIQEGNLGLMIAVEKFNLELGYNFSTYAMFWIKQAITRAISDKGKNLRVPVHALEKYHKYLRIKNELYIQNHENPSLELIASKMGITLDNLNKLVINAGKKDCSLNEGISDDGETTLENYIKDENVDLEENCDLSSLKDIILEVLKKKEFTEREVKIIFYRFGLNGYPILNLNEIGQKFDLTRERVRQLEAKILKKLRNYKEIKDLSVYMDNPDASLEYAKENALRRKKETKKYQKIATINEKVMAMNNNAKEVISKKSSIAVQKSSEVELKSTVKASKSLKKEANQKAGKVYPEINKNLQEKEESKVESYSNDIYSYLKRFDKVLVDAAYDELPLSDKEIIRQKFNGGLVKKSAEYNRFYFTLIPKMKRRMLIIAKELKKKEVAKKIATTKVNKINNTLEISVEEVPKDVISNEEIIDYQVKENIEEENNIVLDNIPDKVNEEKNAFFTKEEYMHILELLESPIFEELTESVGTKEAIIIALKLGYVDGKYFDTKSIASFLDITEDEVNRTLTYTLDVHKDKFIEFIDSTVNNPKKYIKN